MPQLNDKYQKILCEFYNRGAILPEYNATRAIQMRQLIQCSPDRDGPANVIHRVIDANRRASFENEAAGLALKEMDLVERNELLHFAAYPLVVKKRNPKTGGFVEVQIDQFDLSRAAHAWKEGKEGQGRPPRGVKGTPARKNYQAWEKAVSAKLARYEERSADLLKKFASVFEELLEKLHDS